MESGLCDECKAKAVWYPVQSAQDKMLNRIRPQSTVEWECDTICTHAKPEHNGEVHVSYALYPYPHTRPEDKKEERKAQKSMQKQQNKMKKR